MSEKLLQKAGVEDGDKGDKDVAEDEQTTEEKADHIQWKPVAQNCVPRKIIPPETAAVLPIVDVDRSAIELHVFLKLFPGSLLIHIADCTNKRLGMFRKRIQKTD